MKKMEKKKNRTDVEERRLVLSSVQHVAGRWAQTTSDSRAVEHVGSEAVALDKSD